MHFDDTSTRLRMTMFENGNRVLFANPIDHVAREWWLREFFDNHHITPEGMGDLLTRSIVKDKRIVYKSINGRLKNFSLKINGRLDDEGSIWFVDRSFSLVGKIFNAEEMFISDRMQASGLGRSLMNDLIETSSLIGANRIKISARNIGQYAWLRMGFKPDDGSWKDLKKSLLTCVGENQESLGSAKMMELTMQILKGRPEVANVLASLVEPVKSRSLKDGFGEPLEIPLGKSLFLEYAGDWDGEFSISEDTVEKARAYAKR